MINEEKEVCTECKCNSNNRITSLEKQMKKVFALFRKKDNQIESLTKEVKEMSQKLDSLTEGMNSLTNGGLKNAMTTAVMEQNEMLVQQLLDREKSDERIELEKLKYKHQRAELLVKLFGSGFGIAVIKLIFDLFSKRG